MFMILRPGDPEIPFNVWAGSAEIPGAPKAFNYATLHLTGDTGAIVKVVLTDGTGKVTVKVLALATGRRTPVDLGSASVVSLQRTDKNMTAGAGARLINW